MKIKNMKTKAGTFIAVWVIAFLSIHAKGEESAGSILSRMDKTIFSIKDKTADIEMTMIDIKTNKQKVKKAILMQKGADKKLFRYTYPQKDKGIATLSLPNGEIYLYLPMFKKPKKITNMAEGNTFNNSDFSLRDMAIKPYAELYTPKLVKTTADTYVLDLIPKADNKSSYSHLIVAVNKTHYYPEKFEYYDKNGQKVKEAVYHFMKIGKYWVADLVTMTDLKKQHKTRLAMTNIKLNQGLKDNLFTVEQLVPEK